VRYLFLILSIALVLSVPRVGLAQEKEKLNVVFIIADDLGAMDLGCYGSKYHKTPNLDQFATTGIKFLQGYAACPVCSPTRAAFMTGKYPARLNLTDWLPGRADRPDQRLLRPKIEQELPASETTIAQLFKKAGYKTALIGKWHLGGKGSMPEDRGFDVNIGGCEIGTTFSYFAPYQNKNGRVLPGLEKAHEGEYLTDRLGDEAVNFINKNKAEPFFLYISHYAPHTPLRAKPDLVAKYKAGNPGQQGNPNYAAMLESLDESVGKVLKSLDDNKLAEKTIVVFTSDNGGLATLEGMTSPPTINSPLREGKGHLYEGGIRVPLLIRWPGVTKAGTTNAAPISTIDFLPTFVQGCKLESTVKADGVSIMPSLKGEELKREAPLFWHYPHYSNQTANPGSAIREGDWKLLEFAETGRKELFNVKADVSESQNRSAAEPEKVKALAAKLKAWKESVGAKEMTPNPDYKPNPQNKDGVIVMHARTAIVEGVQLRFEPLPHKNTLGFWTNKDDTATFEFTVSKPGKFVVEILQGCGKGSGGSEVDLIIGKQSLDFTVKDTGGFQNFEARDIGFIEIEKEGRYTLKVVPRKKPGVAVMDLRSITLKPVK